MTFKDLAQKLRNTYMSLPSVVDTLVGGFAELNPSGVEAKDVSFDKTGTPLTSDDVEGAIKEIVTESTSTVTVSGGVTATENVLSKSGVVTTLILSTGKITPDATAWVNLGTIPEGYRPKRTFDFVAQNNETENSYLVVTGRIGSNGSLFVWGINGTAITPHIALTYQS